MVSPSRLNAVSPQQEVPALVEELRRQADKMIEVARELTLAAERLERGDGDDVTDHAPVGSVAGSGDQPRHINEVLEREIARILDGKLDDAC